MSLFSEYPIVHEQNVAWGDMDAFGHVNNVMYYRYIESARINYFDALNIFGQKVLTVVASNQCKYLRPVFYPDQLKIAVRVDELRNSAMRMTYQLFSTAQNALVATAEAVIVCVDQENMQKAAIPEDIREKILKMEHAVGHLI
ncbi:acyl-CoA thioesterase [Acinetobacter kanungonis]|uniref:acyl-CoA thioesterase n=1 Tax=Acinetobacter kanungonis TaxID=2699469 RepID=UPI00137B8B87|nr:thioesterase family protein [Acinetobacter kanungonis]NCI78226.1 acyl-CoA thioesterase [Acinetobacter kanungonis]